jgi:hypothetical protein
MGDALKKIFFLLALFVLVAASPSVTLADRLEPPPKAVEAPIDQPYLDDHDVIVWAAQSAADAMTMSYTDAAKRHEESQKYFTKVGWDTFDSAFQRSRIAETLIANEQTLSATPQSAPVIGDKGSLGGKYRWIVQLPLIVDYKGAKETHRDILQLNLVLERVPLSVSPDGVQIAQWVAQ